MHGMQKPVLLAKLTPPITSLPLLLSSPPSLLARCVPRDVVRPSCVAADPAFELLLLSSCSSLLLDLLLPLLIIIRNGAGAL